MNAAVATIQNNAAVACSSSKDNDDNIWINGFIVGIVIGTLLIWLVLWMASP
jgi:hypothetical protein